MSDIVERLKFSARDYDASRSIQSSHNFADVHCSVLISAADEITRLREIVIKYEEQGQDIASDICKELVRLREANKELAEALEKIRDANINAALYGYNCKDTVMALFECNQDATSALSKHKGELK